MDEKDVERLLQREFSSLRMPAADVSFADRVMREIDTDQRIAIDSRRPLIIGAAFFIGLIVALISVTAIDWQFLDSVNAVSQNAFQLWRDAPLWLWLIVFPICWFSMVEA